MHAQKPSKPLDKTDGSPSKYPDAYPDSSIAWINSQNWRWYMGLTARSTRAIIVAYPSSARMVGRIGCMFFNESFRVITLACVTIRALNQTSHNRDYQLNKWIWVYSEWIKCQEHSIEVFSRSSCFTTQLNHPQHILIHTVLSSLQ